MKPGLLTFPAEDQVLLVVVHGVKEHFLLFTELTHNQDFLLGFILLTARLTAEHRNMTLKDRIIIIIIMVS